MLSFLANGVLLVLRELTFKHVHIALFWNLKYLVEV